MEHFSRWVVAHRKFIVLIYILLGLTAVIASSFVRVNTNLADYLPEESSSTKSLRLMEDEYDGELANLTLMIKKVSIAQADDWEKKIKKVSGVQEITGLSDQINCMIPLEVQDKASYEDYYKKQNAKYNICVDGDRKAEVIKSIQTLLDGSHETKYVMSGTAVESKVLTETSGAEIGSTVAIALVIAFLVLILTTTSYFEPVLLLASIGVAILLNSGTNIFQGEISQVTKTASSVLQLGVSIDYSIFLLHRFDEYREQGMESGEAMVKALRTSLTSISSSALTTVIGFAALLLMRYGIGADMGIVMAKGILISMLCVFTLLPAMTMCSYRMIDRMHHKSFIPTLTKTSGAIYKIRKPAIIVFLLLVIPSIFASGKNEFYYGSSHMMRESTQVVKDRDEIEEVFGRSNLLALIVPKDKGGRENELTKELNQLPQMKSIVSYAENVGLSVPETYLDKEIVSKLHSGKYSRMVLSLSCDAESEETFSTIENIRKLSQKQYGDAYYLAGDSVSTIDLRDTVQTDNTRVNIIAILAIFAVLLLSFRKLALPVILVASIEGAIWINLGVPYFTGETLFFIGYLIVSSVQLGATVDYAILMASRYVEMRETVNRKQAVLVSIQKSAISILTSASILTVAGLLLKARCTNLLIAQLGGLLGRGTILSTVIVLIVLPGLLYYFDRWILSKRKAGTGYEK